MTKRPDISFYIKIFLLNPNDQNRQQATSIACTKSEAALEDAYQKKAVPKKECATKEIDENIKFADENGITSLPAIIFPDGSVQFGFSTAAVLEKRIDEAAGKIKRGLEGRRSNGATLFGFVDPRYPDTPVPPTQRKCTRAS